MAALTPDDQQRILKLAEYVAKNGTQMEDMVREKNHGNPSFDFLFGGHGSGFYESKKYEIQQQLSGGPPPPSNHYAAPPQQPPQQPQYGAPTGGYGGSGSYGGPTPRDRGYESAPAPGRGYGGGYGDDNRGGYHGGSRQDGHDYRREGDSSVPCDEQKIDSMLTERMRAKMARDFDTADRIRDDLRRMGVEIFDRERTWSLSQSGGKGGYGGGISQFGGGKGSTGHDYRREDDGSIPCDEPKINSMLAERMRAKMARDFDTADRLRDDLRRMGVEVFDKERTWRVGPGGGGGKGGGSFGGGKGGTGHDYRRDDDGSAPCDLDRINSMLAERMRAKMARDFGTADRIRDDLRRLGVEVFDKERTWRIGPSAGMGGKGGGSFGGGKGGHGNALGRAQNQGGQFGRQPSSSYSAFPRGRSPSVSRSPRRSRSRSYSRSSSYSRSRSRSRSYSRSRSPRKDDKPRDRSKSPKRVSKFSSGPQ